MKCFKSLLLVLSAACLASPVRADEQTRSVQQALKDQGFYYGEVDGETGTETDAAIRRYQIRNGLEVTGKLNQETLSSLNVGNGGGDDSGKTIHAVPPARQVESIPPPPRSRVPKSADSGGDSEPAPPAVVRKDQDFLRRQTAPAPAPESDAGQDAPPSAPPRQEMTRPEVTEEEQTPPPVPAFAAGAYTRVFRHTPYETAPFEVQQSTLRRAQVKLSRQGIYHGLADARPSAELELAISAYQESAGLPESGRLDMETLARLDLLPHRRVVERYPYADAQFDEPPAAPRSVYRGIWVH